MPRTTEPWIELLETVNAIAVNNDDGKTREFLAVRRADDDLPQLSTSLVQLRAHLEAAYVAMSNWVHELLSGSGKDHGASKFAVWGCEV
jgi:hypothetical protein